MMVRIFSRKGRVLTAYGRDQGFRPIFFALLALLFALAAPVQARTLRLVALGDSLTAGYNLPADAAFPARLQKALLEKGFQVEIENAGVSGDTSSGALARLDWAVAADVDGVIVEIGANDMLRGSDPAMTRQNIDAIMQRLQSRKIAILLAGMRAPPNLGPDYAAKFDPLYLDLAKKYDAPLYPFFLEGVAGHKDLQLPDGLHPNRQGVEKIVAGVLPVVIAWIEAMKKQ